MTPGISQEQIQFSAAGSCVHCLNANTPEKEDILSFPKPWFPYF